MEIVELGDCSMAVMQNSDDDCYISLKRLYKEATRCDYPMIVDKGNQITINYLKSTDFIYSGDRLVLYFKDSIPPRFHLHDKVTLDLEMF